MWFIFPQLAGLGISPTAQYYAISSFDEARAYLADPLLGPRLRQCLGALLQWAGTRCADHILGQIDAAREEWWIGLRSAEQEHYEGLGKDFSQDEKFYRCGFEAALHARTRGKEYDQVLTEMQKDLEELKQQYPNADVEEPFRRGYDRGRAYYESLRRQRQQ